MLTCLFTNYVHGNFGSPRLNLSAEGKLGPVSRTASLAVANEFFAHFHSQPKFKVPAAELHETPLRLLWNDLTRKDNSCAERLIVPTTAMLTYDVCCSTHRTASTILLTKASSFYRGRKGKATTTPTTSNIATQSENNAAPCLFKTQFQYASVQLNTNVVPQTTIFITLVSRS
jgi:hypothetical protein